MNTFRPIRTDSDLPANGPSRRNSIRIAFPLLVLLVFIFVFGGSPLPAAETNTIPDASAKGATNAAAAAAVDPELYLRTSLKLQEQLHAALLAIEEGRVESSYEARTNTEALASRLELLEQSLARQREQQWQSAHDSSRLLLLLAAGGIGLGLVALTVTAVSQSRGMNRLAEVAAGLAQEQRAAGTPLPMSLPPGQPQALRLGNGTVNEANRTLLATVGRLQQRIQDLERTAHPELPFTDLPPAGSNLQGMRPLNGTSGTQIDHLGAVLGKAQVLLSLGQVEDALSCCDRAVADAPEHAVAHLHRGQVLAKLGRLDEAVGAYDRAIILNRRLTPAYLGKGAALNLQERYHEALACYEEALRAETSN